MPLHVFQTFTYRLNPQLSAEAEIGARIMVPLGRNSSPVTLSVLATSYRQHSSRPRSKKAQSLVDLDPVCSPEVLELARWVADYYASPLGEVIKAALPPGMTRRAGEALS